MRQPPAAARWLLEQFVFPNHVVGDVNEAFFCGTRSRRWYWRQVLFAVLISGFSDLREHKASALRAVAMGSSVLVAYSVFVVIVLDPYLAAHRIESGVLAGYFVIVPIIGYFAAAAVVGTFYRPTMVMTLLGVIVIGSLLRDWGLTAEWLPSILQPPRWWPATLAFLVSIGCKAVWTALKDSPNQARPTVGERGPRPERDADAD